jgi:hypothetical protein
MKLTTRQKELIKLMREGGDIYTEGRYMHYVSNDEKMNVHFASVGSLHYRGLLNMQSVGLRKYIYSLTNEGKTIEI